MLNKENLFNIIESFKSQTILVIGDLILDEYIRGKTKRLSPEAPVPVLEVQDYIYIAGGAANVAANISTLGGNSILIGVTGDDIQSSILLAELTKFKNCKIDIIIDKSRPTTLKTRLVEKNHYQLARADRESKAPINKDIENSILDKIKSLIDSIDIILLSDYAKGVLTDSLCSNIIDLALEFGKKVIVDPKGSNYKKYNGVELLTPNRLEAEIATNSTSDTSPEQLADKLFNQINIERLLVTLGDEGVLICDKNNNYKKIPAVSSEVFDVTGAGDSLISTIALSLPATNYNLELSVILGNYAAGVAVRKKGTTNITSDEIKNIIEHDYIDEKLIKIL